MDDNKIKIMGGVIMAVLLIVVIFIWAFITGGEDPDDPGFVTATLEFWGVADPENAYANAISSFKSAYPNVTINYTFFDNEEEYERKVLEAMALGQGPDIYMIKNNDVHRNISRISPLPLSYYSLLELRRDFPEIVEKDLRRENEVYGLPLYIDTLALLYNKDIFNREGIVFAPKTWNEAQERVPQITQYGEGDNENEIILSAIAMGGSVETIRTAKDIILSLVMQAGEGPPLRSRNSRASFEFYMSFSDPELATYTWNETMPESRIAFREGKLAMLLDYESGLSTIQSQNPLLNVGVAPIPQLSPENEENVVTNGKYWTHTVSHQVGRRAPHVEGGFMTRIAWDFILHMTTNPSVAERYIDITNRPPAHRELINTKVGDPYLDVFAKQTLIARSWPDPDPAITTAAFNTGILNNIEGRLNYTQAMADISREYSRLFSR